MSRFAADLFDNTLFQMLMQAVFAQTVFTAVMITQLQQVPPEDLLDSSLQEVLLVFED